MAERVFTQPFVVVGAVIERDGHFLLVREGADKGPDAGKLNIPAGWLEVGEHPVDAITREVAEETGYMFTPTHILGIYATHRKDVLASIGVTAHPFRLVFTGVVKNEPTKARESHGVTEVLWKSAEEILNAKPGTLRDAYIKNAIRHYQLTQRFPLEMIHHSVSE